MVFCRPACLLLYLPLSFYLLRTFCITGLLPACCPSLLQILHPPALPLPAALSGLPRSACRLPGRALLRLLPAPALKNSRALPQRMLMRGVGAVATVGEWASSIILGRRWWVAAVAGRAGRIVTWQVLLACLRWLATFVVQAGCTRAGWEVEQCDSGRVGLLHTYLPYLLPLLPALPHHFPTSHHHHFSLLARAFASGFNAIHLRLASRGVKGDAWLPMVGCGSSARTAFRGEYLAEEKVGV